MSIKHIQVPVVFAHQQRNSIVAAAVNEAASVLPQVLRKLIIDDVASIEQREFQDICNIHDNTHKRIVYMCQSSGCFNEEENKILKKMKNQEAKLWRELHYMFIYEPVTLKQYLNEIYPMVVYVKELVIKEHIGYIPKLLQFEKEDF